MLDLLVLGGLGVDIRVRVSSLPPPDIDSTTVPPIDLRIGNTGAGVALAAHAIGLRVGIVDAIGADPLGEIVRAALSRTLIEHVLLLDPRGTRRSVNLVSPDGRRASLYDPRGRWSGPPPVIPTRLAALVRSAPHVHVSIMDWMLELLPQLSGAVVSTDLHDWDGTSDYHRPFIAAADVVFVSGAALGERVEEVSREILTVGRPSLVVAMLGADGALLVERGMNPVRITAAAPPGPVIDTNGAGDALVAGFMAARGAGLTSVECAGYAAAVAAAACTHDGMEYPPGLLPRLRTWEPPFETPT